MFRQQNEELGELLNKSLESIPCMYHIARPIDQAAYLTLACSLKIWELVLQAQYGPLGSYWRLTNLDARHKGFAIALRIHLSHQQFATDFTFENFGSGTGHAIARQPIQRG